MKRYKGNRYPFCCALFTEADEAEAVAVIETLSRQKIRCAVPTRRRADCIARAAVILLFLSPEAVADKTLLKSVNRACSAGKPILTVYLKETRLTPGLSLQLGQTQAVKYREETCEAFYDKLLNAPVLQTMSVTPQQKKAVRRHTLLWAIGGAVVLTAAILLGLYWRPLKATLPTSPLQQLGVPLDFDSIETLYVYGDTKNDAYVMPQYRIYADGEHDWTKVGDRMIPQGDISKLDDFAMLRNLREFCICNNRIDSIEPILSLSQLTLLDVSHERLTDLRGIGALSGLETLNVSHNSLTEIDEIAGLTHLRTLNVAYTGVSSLEALASMPSLETVYIDAKLLTAAEALGGTSIEVVCVDTPIYRYSDLVAALEDPLVTDICLMKSVTVPRGEEISIPAGVSVTGRNPDLFVSVYGTVRVSGVWEMNCKQYNYGLIRIENGGVCAGKTTDTLNLGTFRVERGGRHNLGNGASFTFVGGTYENTGDVYLRSMVDIQFVTGSIYNYGALHLRTSDLPDIWNNIPTERIFNSGLVYLDGFVVVDARPSPADPVEPVWDSGNQTTD